MTQNTTSNPTVPIKTGVFTTQFHVLNGLSAADVGPEQETLRNRERFLTQTSLNIN